MEILEHEDHPFFLGTQFHPEFRSRPDRASPPFVGFLEAVIDRHEASPSDDSTDSDYDNTEDEVTI